MFLNQYYKNYNKPLRTKNTNQLIYEINIQKKQKII